MTSPRQHVIEWLRDIHAAEEQAHTMLGKTAQQIDGYAEFSVGLDRHAQLSGQQAVRLKKGLEALGESTSTIKQAAGQTSAFFQTLSGRVVGDEPVKAVLSIASFAQMEVTSYRILSVAAAIAGLDEITRLCQSHLEQEEDFLRWLEGQSEAVTQEYLAEEEISA